MYFYVGKERLSDYLKIEAEEAKDIIHSFLGMFCFFISFIYTGKYTLAIIAIFR